MSDHSKHTRLQKYPQQPSQSGGPFVDMLAGMVAVVESPPRLHEKLEDLGPMHIRKGVQASYMPQVSPAHLYRRAFQCRQSLSCRTCAAIFFLF
eukprot:1785296-Rhodomonas_salina.2